MNTPIKYLLRLIAISALTMLVGGCGARTVVDEQGKPLAGVHVVATYWGESFYITRSNRACFRMEVMVTGADGTFEVPFLSGNFNPLYFDRSRHLQYFKPGYEAVPMTNDSADPFVMRPFGGSTAQRFNNWNGAYVLYRPQLRCKDARKKLHPVLISILGEAKQLARTYEERRRVLEFEYQNEIDLGVDENAASRLVTEKRQLLRKEFGLQGIGD